MLILKCKNCKAELFFDSTRGLKCGKCGAPITFELTKNRTGIWKSIKRLFGASSGTPRLRRLGGSNIQTKLDLLAKAAWGTRDDIERERDFVLSTEVVARSGNEETINVLLTHVRRVAPGLNLPRGKPKVTIRSMEDSAAGRFTAGRGEPEVAVNTNFFQDVAGARSILCHELCHYVLYVAGIHQTPEIENERLTDAAMFSFGLGSVFLGGYKRAAESRTKAGHRIGYLSDEEYFYADWYVRALRDRTGEFASRADELETKLRTVVPDVNARNRYITGYWTRHPLWTAAQVYEAILQDIERDNR